MKDTERRKYEMFLRVRECVAGRAAEFPPGSLALELLSRLGGVISELDAHMSITERVVRTTEARRV